jgi:hypothetical protein
LLHLGVADHCLLTDLLGAFLACCSDVLLLGLSYLNHAVEAVVVEGV